MRQKKLFLSATLFPLLLGSTNSERIFSGFSTTVPDLNGVYVTLSVDEPNNNGYSYSLSYRNKATDWNNVNIFSKTITNSPTSGSIKSKYISPNQIEGETIFTFSPGFFYKDGTYFKHEPREFTLYNYNNFTFEINNEGNGEVVSKNKYTSWPTGIDELKINFQYENFYKDVDSNNYREIDLSIFKAFSYKKPSSIYIFIKDPKHIFNDELLDQETGFIKIPLSLNNGSYTIEENFKLYVDPISRESSLIQHENYFRTRHLYLPINTYEKTQKLECSIFHENFDGYNNNIKYDFTYYIREEFYGSCYNSTYCLDTKQNYENNDLEKVYEVVYD